MTSGGGIGFVCRHGVSVENVGKTEIKNFLPDLSQSILPALMFRPRLAAALHTLFPVKHIGEVDEVDFFLESSNFTVVHGPLPPKQPGDLAYPEHSQEHSQTRDYGATIFQCVENRSIHSLSGL
jgi:hypothetical protein